MSAREINFRSKVVRCIDQTGAPLRKHRGTFSERAAPIEIPLINLTFTVFRPRGWRGGGASLQASQRNFQRRFTTRRVHGPTRGWLDRRQLAPFLLALTHTLPTSFDPFGGVEETVREFGQLLAALLWRSQRTTWQSIPLWMGRVREPTKKAMSRA